MLKPTAALVKEGLYTRSRSTRLGSSLLRFRDDESGVMTIFILFIFVLMFVFGGIAVDYMRFEIRRVAMHQTLDRAALAASSLTQTKTPQDVVEDYFDKEGLGDGLVMVEYTEPTVVVEESASGGQPTARKVNVSASVRSYNYFMGSFFLPYEYLEGPSRSQAEMGTRQIEVMLVLDVTGSMSEMPPGGGSQNKMASLKDAANLFVDLVKDPSLDPLNLTSIGIVPYNTQVNLGPQLRAQFNATNIPTVNGVPNVGVANSNCLEPPTTPVDFGQTAMSTTTPMPMSVFADLESGTSTGNTSYYTTWSSNAPANPNSNGSNYMCPPYAYSQVLLPTMDDDVVKAKINSLQPNGRTSIMMGMRWGAALIDEEAREIYDNLITEPEMEGRPANNLDPETRKILILMTDGNHVATKFIRDPYKTGISPIFRSNNDNNFSILLRPLTNPLPYWVPHLCTTAHNCAAGWRAQPWTNNANTGTFRQLDWSEVWQAVRPTWVARQLYGRSNYTGAGVTNIYNAQLAAFRGDTYLSKAVMDARLQTICNAAKAEQIEVFGIAFGAGTDGENQIRGCASSGNPLDPSDKSDYFFRPQTAADLEAAFRDIAEKMSPLRLTR